MERGKVEVIFALCHLNNTTSAIDLSSGLKNTQKHGVPKGGEGSAGRKEKESLGKET